MKTITKYVTLDSAEHVSQYDAKRHLDNLHANLLQKIALNVINTGQGKYALTCDWIDANLEQFVYLTAIKADMLFSEPDDNEDGF